MRKLADIRKVLHAEGVLPFAQEFIDGFVEAFGMEAKNFSGVHAQRTVDENRNARQLIGQRELMKGIDNLLSSADRKRRDDDQAFAIESFANQFPHLFIGKVLERMIAPAVGAFNLQVIDVVDRLRVAEDVVFPTANVATKQITKFAP